MEDAHKPGALVKKRAIFFDHSREDAQETPKREVAWRN
jgi:hypothetical protein